MFGVIFAALMMWGLNFIAAGFGIAPWFEQVMNGCTNLSLYLFALTSQLITTRAIFSMVSTIRPSAAVSMRSLPLFSATLSPASWYYTHFLLSG